jgi:hypothetical protein
MASTHHTLDYVTLGGVPLRFELQWPFHKSTSGADWQVLHGKAQLLSDPEGQSHAEFSANFTQTIVEALPSLDPVHAESVAINAVRVATDAGKLEFLKSGKRLPVEVSSRFLNLKTHQVQFPKIGEERIKDFLKKKLYWLGLRSANPAARIWIADPTDAQYLSSTREQFVQVASALEAAGLCVTEGDFACASGQLEQQAEYFQSELQKTVDRAVAKFNLAMKQ